MPELPKSQQLPSRQLPPPRLVNRGPAGLLTRKLTPATAGGKTLPGVYNDKQRQELWATAPKDRISPSLMALVVPIESLRIDPNNARIHPERNMDSIKDSLCLYGQKKAIVVRQQTMTIVAGNGTFEAARQLGWTKIAASVEPMTEIEAAGYGLADNRTAELARWDFEVMGRLDKLMQEAEAVAAGAAGALVGWSADEIAILRKEWSEADVTPPSTGGSGAGGLGEAGATPLVPSNSNGAEGMMVLKPSPEQENLINLALATARMEADTQTVRDEELLALICNQWLDSRGV